MRTTIICSFNVQTLSGAMAAWSVPISFDKEPLPSQIQAITEEVTNRTKGCTVLDMYAMCREDFTFIYKSDNVTEEDIKQIFDTSSLYDRKNK